VNEVCHKSKTPRTIVFGRRSTVGGRHSIGPGLLINPKGDLYNLFDGQNTGHIQVHIIDENIVLSTNEFATWRRRPRCGSNTDHSQVDHLFKFDSITPSERTNKEPCLGTRLALAKRFEIACFARLCEAEPPGFALDVLLYQASSAYSAVMHSIGTRSFHAGLDQLWDRL
jgi:hypothetical protein